jgi:hypothetical protein
MENDYEKLANLVSAMIRLGHINYDDLRNILKSGALRMIEEASEKK